MSNEVNVFDLPEEGSNTDLTTVEVEKLGDVNITQNVDAVPAGGLTGQVLAKNSNTDYDTEWITGGGGGGSDENYTTAEKNKLASITEIFITALKNAYDSAVAWIATNGAALISHTLNTNNPHDVDKAQIGLGNVPNLDTSTTANITDSTGKRFVSDAMATNSTALLSHLLATNNPHDVDKAQIGLNNVDNTADADKPVSTAQQTALNLKVDKNANITGATKTKITYDLKGLVTSGADATTADIADSADKRYITDAQQTVIGNTSGANTGDNATNSQYSGLEASKENTITVGTTAQYWRGDKTFQTLDKTAVGLGNVPNISFSGSNTGDETTGTIQTKRPLKTINSESIEGAGNIVISGGGSISIAKIIALG